MAAALGNPIGGGSLYRVDYPNGTPTLIATGVENPKSILGRRSGATFIATGVLSSSIIRITDDGAVVSLASYINQSHLPLMHGNWIGYVGQDEAMLMGIALDGDNVPQLLVGLGTLTSLGDAYPGRIRDFRILDDYFWFQPYLPLPTTERYRYCYLTRANRSLGPTCNDVDMPLPCQVSATSGDQLFGAIGIMPATLESLDVSCKTQLTLYLGESGRLTTYEGGWLYSLYGAPATLVRYPTSVGRSPQEVLPASVAQAAFPDGFEYPQRGTFAVGSTGIFWSQSRSGRESPQYIFHAPLPPQPCDDGLPCADITWTCINGYCAAP